MKFLRFSLSFLIALLINSCAFLSPVTSSVDFEAANPLNGLYYEVFVRSFADSNSDGIGDLKGLTNQLDYLEDLGVGGIWLMPIHPSPSYHGYDVTDYYGINEDYGTLADFEALVSEANKRNIKIMIDLVINHTSDQHPWFQAALKNDATYASWYRKRDYGYFNIFGGYMPDLNLSNAAVVSEIKAIMDYWLGKGVSGFRIDAAKHLFDYSDPKNLEVVGATARMNYNFLDSLRTHARLTNPNAYFVAEVLDSEFVYKSFYAGSDSLFNFDLINTITNLANTGALGSNPYVSRLKTFYSDFRSVNAGFIDAPLISNHDRNRIAEALNGNSDKLKMAAELYLLLPGNPFIYYGEELGMFGYRVEGLSIPGYSGAVYDETRRLPFPWGTEATTSWIVPSVTGSTYNDKNRLIESQSVQATNPNSLLKTYQTLGQLRKNNIALAYGNTFVPYAGNTTTGLQGYYRYYELDGVSQLVLVLHNVSQSSGQPVTGLTYQSILYGEADYTNQTVAKQSTVVFELDSALWATINQ